HYWVGDDEIEKLLRRGEGWLAAHPEREAITTRYLKYRRSLINDALSRLVGEESPHVDETQAEHAQEEAKVEEKISLNEQRTVGLFGKSTVKDWWWSLRSLK